MGRLLLGIADIRPDGSAAIRPKADIRLDWAKLSATDPKQPVAEIMNHFKSWFIY
jgi:hypothetical protein